MVQLGNTLGYQIIDGFVAVIKVVVKFVETLNWFTRLISEAFSFGTFAYVILFVVSTNKPRSLKFAFGSI